MFKKWHYKTPPDLIHISKIIPAPLAKAIEFKHASETLAPPDIKSPATKSLTPLINATPESNGIIDPTIIVVGEDIKLKSVNVTAINEIVIEATKLENAEISVVLNTLLYIIDAVIEAIVVKIKLNRLYSPIKHAKLAHPIPVARYVFKFE